MTGEFGYRCVKCGTAPTTVKRQTFDPRYAEVYCPSCGTATTGAREDVFSKVHRVAPAQPSRKGASR